MKVIQALRGLLLSLASAGAEKAKKVFQDRLDIRYL